MNPKELVALNTQEQIDISTSLKDGMARPVTT
jgi:hypothetical protein